MNTEQQQINTHSTLLRAAMDIAKDSGMSAEQFAKELNLSAVRVYAMIKLNFVPIWHWPKIEEITHRNVRREDFLAAQYNRPNTRK